MKPKRLCARLTLALLVSYVSAVGQGCGLFLTHGPPEGHEHMQYFTCTENNLGPVFDAANAVSGALLAIIAASDEEACSDGMAGPTQGGCMAMGAVSAALYGSSAIVGFNKTKKCRAAIRQLRERQAQQLIPGTEQQIHWVVQSVAVIPSADTLAVGERLQLTASAYNLGGAIIPNRMFAWSSSNDAIASVNGTGLVTAHATGAVVVAARTGDVVGTANLVVVARR